MQRQTRKIPELNDPQSQYTINGREAWRVLGIMAEFQHATEQLIDLRPAVSMFGSARIRAGHPYYDIARTIARKLSDAGFSVISGGGPGLMQAANEGAAAGAALSGQSIGIRVDLPFEQSANPFVEQVFEHRTFFTRLHHFVLASDAFVVTPGGIGTVLETLMIWQLLQVRHLHDTPLILVGAMWSELVRWAHAHMLDPRLALVNPEDLSIPRCVATADEAITAIREHHARWRHDRGNAAAAPAGSHDTG